MKYIKKPVDPVVVEAVQIKNEIHTLKDWDNIMPKWFMDSIGYTINPDPNENGIYVKTSRGEIFAPWGSYIVYGENVYWLDAYGKDFFENTYEVYNG